MRLVVDNDRPPAANPAPAEPPVTAQMALTGAMKTLPRKAVVAALDADGNAVVTWGGMSRQEALDLAATAARLLSYE